VSRSKRLAVDQCGENVGGARTMRSSGPDGRRADMPRSASTWGLTEAAAIYDLIAAGHREAADDQLRHYVHGGVTPTELFETAMALADQRAGR